MKKILNNPITILTINIVLTIIQCVINLFYQMPAPAWCLPLKYIGSAVCLGLGTINLIYGIANKSINFKFSVTMLIGLAFSFGGDVAIEYEFVIGAALFAIAHISFLVGFFFVRKFQWLDVFISLIFIIPAVALLLTLNVFTFKEPALRYVCAIYCVIIGFMFGKSLSNLIFKRDFLSLVSFIAALLFVVSDFCLLLHLFTTLGYKWGHGCMALYFPALLVYAYSIYYQNKHILTINPIK